MAEGQLRLQLLGGRLEAGSLEAVLEAALGEVLGEVLVMLVEDLGSEKLREVPEWSQTETGTERKDCRGCY